MFYVFFFALSPKEGQQSATRWSEMCGMLMSSVCFRSTPQAQEGAGVFGAPLRTTGDPLVLQI